MNAEKILVVDDEPDICGLVSDILTDEGYQVSAAENAASARHQITQSSYDLVLLDIWMPDEDGITLLKDWKDNKLLHCPVVMMSDMALSKPRLKPPDLVRMHLLKSL